MLTDSTVVVKLWLVNHCKMSYISKYYFKKTYRRGVLEIWTDTTISKWRWNVWYQAITCFLKIKKWIVKIIYCIKTINVYTRLCENDRRWRYNYCFDKRQTDFYLWTIRIKKFATIDRVWNPHDLYAGIYDMGNLISSYDIIKREKITAEAYCPTDDGLLCSRIEETKRNRWLSNKCAIELYRSCVSRAVFSETATTSPTEWKDIIT